MGRLQEIIQTHVHINKCIYYSTGLGRVFSVEILGHSIWVVGAVRNKREPESKALTVCWFFKIKWEATICRFSVENQVDWSQVREFRLQLFFPFSYPSSLKSVTCVCVCVRWGRVDLSVLLVSVHARLCSAVPSAPLQMEPLENPSSCVLELFVEQRGQAGRCHTASRVFLRIIWPVTASWALSRLAPVHQEVAFVKNVLSGLERKEEKKRGEAAVWRFVYSVVCEFFCLFIFPVWLNGGEWHIITLHGRENISQALVWICQSMCVYSCVCISMHTCP